MLSCHACMLCVRQILLDSVLERTEHGKIASNSSIAPRPAENCARESRTGEGSARGRVEAETGGDDKQTQTHLSSSSTRYIALKPALLSARTQQRCLAQEQQQIPVNDCQRVRPHVRDVSFDRRSCASRCTRARTRSCTKEVSTSRMRARMASRVRRSVTPTC
jgi:hypothetical protein